MKKRLLFVLLVLALASPALATETDVFCKGFYDIAFTVMTARQDRMPLPELLAEINNLEASEKQTSVLHSLVMSAYARPLYSSDVGKQNAASDFANDSAGFCYSVLSK